MDTDAERTLIPEHLFKKFKFQYISKLTPANSAPGLDAQGNTLNVEQKLFSMKFIFEDHSELIIDKATIGNFPEYQFNSKILLGMRYICINKLEVKFNETSYRPQMSIGSKLCNTKTLQMMTNLNQ